MFSSKAWLVLPNPRKLYMRTKGLSSKVIHQSKWRRVTRNWKPSHTDFKVLWSWNVSTPLYMPYWRLIMVFNGRIWRLVACNHQLACMLKYVDQLPPKICCYLLLCEVISSCSLPAIYLYWAPGRDLVTLPHAFTMFSISNHKIAVQHIFGSCVQPTNKYRFHRNMDTYISFFSAWVHCPIHNSLA